MSKAVSINRSRAFEHVVQKCSGDKSFAFNESGKNLFITIREFLTFCALIGFQNKKRMAIDYSLGTENIQGVIYEDTEALEFIWLIALAETEDINLLQDGNEKKCAEIFEEYANGGLQIVSDNLCYTPHEHWPSKIYELTYASYQVSSK